MPFARSIVTALLLSLAVFLPTAPAAAQSEIDGSIYPIGNLSLRYIKDNGGHPSLAEVMALPVMLGQTEGGYVAPREDVPTVTLTLREIADRPTENYYGSAIQHLLEHVRDCLVNEQLLGVFAGLNPTQIAPSGEDLRGSATDLEIVITTGILSSIRTVGTGDRVAVGGEIEPEDRINHPLHDRVLRDVPVRPLGADGADEAQALIRRDILDDYLFFLGRHPGRRVDAAVSASDGEVGTLNLDLIVNENRPLVLYAQLANNGTPSTDRLRERFGLVHSQFTNRDDILSLDYTTAGFDEVHYLQASYEAPIFNNPRLRGRVYGAYSEFTADEVGFFGDTFEGDSWELGVEVAWNFWQRREAFLDLVAGIRYENIHVDNQAFLIEGEESFLFPYIGLRYDRTTEWFSTRGSLMLEFQDGDFSDTDPNEVSALGRTFPDEDWQVLKWDLTHSFYLEPLFNRAAWEDPSTPESSTLAHELRLRFFGQHAFDNRLIPQVESVVGGSYTVRGYPESILAADGAAIGSIEYRYHVPRAFAVEGEPGELFGNPFRFAPQYVYGVPDWDLVLKGFFDIATTSISDPLFFENDETIMGAGVGVDFIYKRNVNIRADWGFALDDLEVGQVNSGSQRFHFVVTLLF